MFKLYTSTLYYPYWLKKCKVDSVVRHSIVLVYTFLFRHFVPTKSLPSRSTKPRIIASLTSFPKRIGNVDLVVRSLMNQTHQPNKVVLWLSKEQFSSLDSLPKRLLRLRKHGLDIRLVDGDIRSHKKYQYAFREFPNEYVMLADDDILYPRDTIEKLYNGISPETVHCSYGCIVTYDADGKTLPYKEWPSCAGLTESQNFFFGSGGGTMMMPSSFVPDILDINKAITLTPTADDIWLNTMARLSNLKIRKVRTGLIFPVTNSKDNALAVTNVDNGNNDRQLAAIQKEYPSAFRKQ